MFDYEFIIFGINCDYKFITNFFTGFTYAIFSAFLIQIPLTLKMSDNIYLLTYKIFCTLLMTSNLITYTFIKFKFNKIIELQHELKNYQIECLLKRKNENFSSIIAIIFSVASTIISVATVYNHLEYKELAKEMSLYISFNQQIPVYELYLNSWMIAIQFIYYDLYIRYWNIIYEFNIEVERRIAKPSINVIFMTRRTVLMFSRFKWNLKKNLDFIKYFIFINNFSLNLVLICALITYPYFNQYHYELIISNIMLLNAYFLWTQISVHKTNYYERKLEQNLNKWQIYRQEEKIVIELKVLKRTVREFYKYEKSTNDSYV